MFRFSSLMSLGALLAAATVVAIAARPAVAADAVLLASTVPGYVPGMVVAENDRLSVPDGASATLLFQSGEMLRLSGPFEGTLGQQKAKPGETSVSMLADMFRSHGVDATVIGGTRSTGTTRPVGGIDDVLVDAQHSGTYCIDQTTSVWITRPVGDARVYAVRRKGSSRTLAWPAGAERAEWPGDVPIDDASQFEIATDGTARATVTFRAMPSGAASIPAAVASAILLGCHDQFDGELRRISRSLGRPELWLTSDHGRRPTYHPGEPVALTVMADTDGYLYCFASNTDGTTVPIFPAGAVDGAQVRGSVALSIPGRRQPMGLAAVAGLEQINCWLADRDITPELPHALLGPPTVRVPDQIAGDLHSLFSRIGGTRIESDVLTVKTE
jgi:Domain of unknown function (DUF4384)